MVKQKSKILWAILTYWILLGYIIAALIWWYVSLNNLVNENTQIRLREIVATDANYTAKRSAVLDLQRRSHAKYLGEGIAFLALICIGAVYIFRSVRRQLNLNRQQQNFMMAITHELKTPIAVTQLNLQTLQKHNLNTEQKSSVINAALSETKRLNDLCNNILITAQLDNNRNSFVPENINADIIIETTIAALQQRFTNHIISYSKTGLQLVAEPLLFQLLISNLLENACKYSPENSLIIIETSQTEHTAIIKVKDEGMGIPDKEKENIFKKFYRIGNEDTRHTKGTGLGLYICKRIMNFSKGQLLLEDNKPQGSIFTAIFKL
jgi:two-component system, OmpR family, sensor histidine kinase CiaH